MNIIDFFIIYLACGAPCGVYFFLQNRKKLNPKNLWLKSFLTVFVWIPYAFVLLNDFATKKVHSRRLKEKSAFEDKFSELQRKLLQFHFDSSAGHSLFEFREVLERYAGLTLAANSNNKIPNPVESEIFRIALRENSELGAECLRRRNYSRLKFHQNLARQDFLKLLSDLKTSAPEPKKLREIAIELSEFLNDIETTEKITEIFIQTLQSPDELIIQNLENEVWNSKEIEPQSSSRIPLSLKTFITATAKKD